MKQPPANTPRTDKHSKEVVGNWQERFFLAEAFSKQLERELNAEKAKNLAVEAYRRALDAIIADPTADAVQIAHEAIAPYTDWVAAGPEASAALDRAAGITR